MFQHFYKKYIILSALCIPAHLTCSQEETPTATFLAENNHDQTHKTLQAINNVVAAIRRASVKPQDHGDEQKSNPLSEPAEKEDLPFSDYNPSQVQTLASNIPTPATKINQVRNSLSSLIEPNNQHKRFSVTFNADNLHIDSEKDHSWWLSNKKIITDVGLISAAIATIIAIEKTVYRKKETRFMTGIEPAIAGFALSKIAGAAQVMLCIGVVWKIKKTIDGLYFNNIKKAQDETEAKMAQFQSEVDQNFTTINIQIDALTNSLAELAQGVLDHLNTLERQDSKTEALKAEATETLKNIHQIKNRKINPITNQRKVTPTGCCSSGCMIQ